MDETSLKVTSKAGGRDEDARGRLLTRVLSRLFPTVAEASRSHEYDLTFGTLFRSLLPTLFVLVALALLLHAGHRLNWLPQPAIAWDPDRAVLGHQLLASRTEGPAEIVVTGDSTCLVGVDPVGLTRHLPGQAPVLNLALYIWLGLDTYGELVSDFAAAHPGQVHAVVLLVSTAKLTGMGQGEAGKDAWQQVRADTEQSQGAGDWSISGDWLGARQLRGHLLSHLLATPLHGSGAAYYGFSSEIDTYMTAHHGSLVGFGTSVLPRRRHGVETPISEWTLDPAVEAQSRAFRAQVPAGAKLFIGFTPGMAGASSPADRRLRLALLGRWNQYLHADALLTNLPPTLPDVFFFSGGHLNATGQRHFTRSLGRELAPLLR